MIKFFTDFALNLFCLYPLQMWAILIAVIVIIIIIIVSEYRALGQRRLSMIVLTVLLQLHQKDPYVPPQSLNVGVTLCS